MMKQSISMKNIQKGSILLWIVIGAVIVVALGLGMRYFSVPRSTIQQNDLADWKTYTNKQYSFSFQYPAGFTAEQNDGDGSDPDVGWIRIYCTIYESACSGQEMDIYISKSSRILEPQTNAAVTTTLTNGDYTYAIATRNISQETSKSPIVDEGASIDVAVAKQIISTIEFTASSTTSVAEWRTYTDTYLGISFKYPSDWFIIPTPNPNIGDIALMIQSPARHDYFAKHPDGPGGPIAEINISKENLRNDGDQILFNGMKATRITYTGDGPTFQSILVNRGTHTYDIRTETTEGIIESEIVSSIIFGQ